MLPPRASRTLRTFRQIAVLAIVCFGVTVGISLVASYWFLKIPELRKYELALAQSQPDCGNMRVQEALAQELRRRGSVDSIQSFLDGRYVTRYEEENPSHGHLLLIRVARSPWMRLVMSDDETAAAFCASGNGHGGTLPRLARLVGISSLSAATDWELRALSETYLRAGSLSDEQIERYYRHASRPLPEWVNTRLVELQGSGSSDEIEEGEYKGLRVFERIRGDRFDTGDEHILLSDGGKTICVFGGYVGRVTSGSCEIDEIAYVRTLYRPRR